ncbi:B9 domain-containing protein 2 [Sabethes cyaneus]|uniref:B9 domain-containing protein 2 n=1 Tax=Sabethes cyaneus TaxID=53552 RepID=UPI00237E43D8|nr:B9 domain-containing protein 2 [Sabethes cyaneus]
MAELYVFGELCHASEYEEPNLFCKWSVQFGSCWKVVEGHSEGQSSASSARVERRSYFSTPIDLHLACRGIQGWPKLHVEVFALDSLNNYWPVGYGFAYLPSQPGLHRVRVDTWKVSSPKFFDTIREKFHSGGFTVAKSDIVFSGIERYKLLTKTSGSVEFELMLMFRNFAENGVELH